jgi:hypothetical protein
MRCEGANGRISRETEFAAMHSGLFGLAAETSKHAFLAAKRKRIGTFEDQLATHIGGEQSVLFSCQTYIRVIEGNTYQ